MFKEFLENEIEDLKIKIIELKKQYNEYTEIENKKQKGIFNLNNLNNLNNLKYDYETKVFTDINELITIDSSSTIDKTHSIIAEESYRQAYDETSKEYESDIQNLKILLIKNLELLNLLNQTDIIARKKSYTKSEIEEEKYIKNKIKLLEKELNSIEDKYVESEPFYDSKGNKAGVYLDTSPQHMERCEQMLKNDGKRYDIGEEIRKLKEELEKK